jgi:hypothetical protein
MRTVRSWMARTAADLAVAIREAAARSRVEAPRTA